MDSNFVFFSKEEKGILLYVPVFLEEGILFKNWVRFLPQLGPLKYNENSFSFPPG
jgi:hypothetical protein